MKTIFAVLIAFIFIASIADNEEELTRYIYSILGVATIFLIVYILKIRQNKKKIASFPFSFYSKVVGVTYDNDDGSSRQENIKKYLSVGDELHIKVYSYKGEPAIALLAKEGRIDTQVGHLSAELASEIVSLPDDAEVAVVVKDITGGTKNKLTFGVNVEILSTHKI